MPGAMLSERDWDQLSQLLQRPGRVYNTPEHRRTLEGLLYRMRTGCPWRDLPGEFGHWNTVFRRVNLWSSQGVWARVFTALSFDSDTEWLCITPSIVRAHQHSHGVRGRTEEAIVRSRGGASTKIPIAVDSSGLPVHYELSGGPVHEMICARTLRDGAPRTSLPTKATTATRYVSPSKPKARCRSSLGEATARWARMAWTGAWTRIDISWRTPSHEASTSEPLRPAMTNSNAISRACSRSRLSSYGCRCDPKDQQALVD